MRGVIKYLVIGKTTSCSSIRRAMKLLSILPHSIQQCSLVPGPATKKDIVLTDGVTVVPAPGNCYGKIFNFEEGKKS